MKLNQVSNYLGICIMDGCGNPIENFDTKLCASHSYEQRKAERQAKKVKIVHQIPKVSEKRADELAQYPKMRKQFLEFKMICEFEGCKDRSEQVHHTSKSALNFLNTDTWMAVCVNHHNFIEREMSAEERRAKGYLID